MTEIFIPIISTYRFLPLRGDKPDFMEELKIEGTKNKGTVKIEDIPHHALIVYGGYYCSGSLIRSQIILTAASCFLRRSNQKIVVKLGANTMTEPGQILSVLELRLHEYFDHKKNWNNDIALLVLEEHVTFSAYTKKVVLVETETALKAGTSIEVSSWSYLVRPSLEYNSKQNANVRNNNNLLLTKMYIIPQKKCKETYSNNLISSSNFCAKYHSDRRLSDNGGGATNEGRLVGVVSFGATNKNEPYVAVFTNISYYYRWITLNTQRFLEKYCLPTEATDSYYSEYYSEEEHEELSTLYKGPE